MTNTALKWFIKIWYSDNIERRRKELSNTSVPYPFTTYAIYETDKPLADKDLHAIIDDLKPDLRASKDREFYIMDKEDAFVLLSHIAKINWLEDRLHLIDVTDEQKKEEKEFETIENEVKQRLSSFKFSKCNIKIWEEITFFKDDNIVVTVIGDDKVKYKNKTYSLSALAKELLWINYMPRWPEFFKYKWVILTELREKVHWTNDKITLRTKTVKKQSHNSWKKRSPFKFSMVWIKPWDRIYFVKDESLVITVHNDNQVMYNWKPWALSPLARVLLKRNSTPQGQEFFTFNWKKLTQLRDEIEEGNNN